MTGFPEGCCDIKRAITSTNIDCTDQKGGAYDLRIACKRYVSFSEYDCDGVDSDGGAPSTSGDRRVYDIVTDDGLGSPTAQFYTVETRDKTLEYLWTVTFDPDTGNRVDTETINFSVDIKDREIYCTIKEMIGQQIVALFREKGSDRWFMAGRYGDLTVNEISGGTGTNEFSPTNFVISGSDISEYFVEVYDGTSIASTTTLIDGVTAA
jgi:hypothetical protein